MTRRSITEEARKRREEADDDADAEASTDTDDDTGERRRFTQRMPEPLVDDIDDFADSHGMSRNAAINLLAKTGLEKF